MFADPVQLLGEAVLVGPKPVQVGAPANGVLGEVDGLLDLFVGGAEELGGFVWNRVQ